MSSYELGFAENANVLIIAVSPQVKWIFTMSRTRGQRSSKTCGLHSQSSTAVTHCLLIAPHFTDLGRMEAWVYSLPALGIEHPTLAWNHSVSQTDLNIIIIIIINIQWTWLKWLCSCYAIQYFRRHCWSVLMTRQLNVNYHQSCQYVVLIHLPCSANHSNRCWKMYGQS